MMYINFQDAVPNSIRKDCNLEMMPIAKIRLLGRIFFSVEDLFGYQEVLNAEIHDAPTSNK